MVSPAKLIVVGLCFAPLAQAQSSELTSTAQASLERLVKQDCGSCHGLTLKGGLGRAITPEAMQTIDRTTLRDIILDGIPGTAMPPWRPLLSETQAMWIADYLKKGTDK